MMHNSSYTKNLIFFLVIFFGVFCSAQTSFAKELYVNGVTGNDSTTYATNDTAHPWATLGRAVWGSTTRTSPNQTQAAQAGDTVNVAEGVYTTTQGTGTRYIPTYNPANSGTAGNYITFKCTSGTCELRSTGPVSPIAGAYQRNYIKWIGFYVDQNNISYCGDSGLMVAWDSSYIELSGNDLQARYISFGEAGSNNHSCIRIEAANNILVKNNRLYGAIGDNGGNDAAITLYRSGYLIIENNNIYDSYVGIFIKATINYSPYGSGESLGPITVRYNLLYDITGPAIYIHRAKDGRIYQNVIRDSRAGIAWQSFPDPTPTDTIVANNTIYNNTINGIGVALVDASYINDKTWNNIVANTPYAVRADDDTTCSAIDFEHNLYYNFTTFARVFYTNYTFATWQSTFSQDSANPASLNSDPLFVNAAGDNFKLQPGSPAINAGIDVLDLDGDSSTTDPITMGAYITGNEVIGVDDSGISPDTTPPAAPTGVTIL